MDSIDQILTALGVETRKVQIRQLATVSQGLDGIKYNYPKSSKNKPYPQLHPAFESKWDRQLEKQV